MERLWGKAAILTSVFVAAFAGGCTSVPGPSQLQTTASLAEAPPEQQTPPADPKTSKNNLLRLGADIEARGSVATALPLYERAATLPDADASVHIALADAYVKLNRDQDGANAYRQALSMEPGNPRAQFGLGSVQIRAGQVEAGLELLVKSAPALNTPEAYDRLGVAHIMAEQPREALASFEQAYGLSTKDPDISTNLALAAALLGQEDRVASLARATLQFPGLEPYHRRNLILALAISGNTQDARNAAADALAPEEVEQMLERAAKVRKISDPSARARALGTVRVANARG